MHYVGTLRKYDHQRGFGFIEADDPQQLPPGIGRSVFVHVSAFLRAGVETVEEGDRFEFDITTAQQPGKYKACDVRLIEEAPEAPVRFGT